MKTRETTPGKTYSVHTMKGCTIIEPDGWQKTIEAPDGYFDAHFGSVVIEGDDEASIKQLFKLAPQQRLAILGVLGGGVPAWLAPLKAELTALLDGSKFELAWLAGEKKLVVHTDRVSDELSEAVTALLERVVPQFVDVESSNYLPMQRIMKKLPPLLDSALGGEGRHNLNYDEAAATVAVEIAYPNLDDESAAQVDAILAHELPPEVSMSRGYGVTPYVVDYLLYEYEWMNPTWELNNNTKDTKQPLNEVFPRSIYRPMGGVVLPENMPFPEKLAAKTNLFKIFSYVPIKKLPKAWLFEKATSIENMFDADWDAHTLTELPEGITFENVTNANLAFRWCRNLKKLPDSVTFENLVKANSLFATTGLTATPRGVSFSKVTTVSEFAYETAITKIDDAVTFENVENGWRAFYGRPITAVPDGFNLSKMSEGSGMFHGSRLDKESALRVLNTIPAWNDGKAHSLTIGIHVDHKTDDEVLAAIAEAENTGWTLTVQWKGTPTAQAATTYGLRKPPIYARVSEHEMPDGTTERVLDWGHYVTDATGYEEFRSVEAAREYFGLPEEDLTNA